MPMEKNAALLWTIVFLIIIGYYFFIYKQMLRQADEDDGPNSLGSAIGVFFLMIFISLYGFNYLYSFLHREGKERRRGMLK